MTSWRHLPPPTVDFLFRFPDRQNYLKRKQPVTWFRFLVASRIAKHFFLISSSYFISSFVVCGCYRTTPSYQLKGKTSSTVSFFYLYVHLFVSLSVFCELSQLWRNLICKSFQITWNLNLLILYTVFLILLILYKYTPIKIIPGWTLKALIL